MTIKQQGGVFGRNPTFNNVEVDGSLDVANWTDVDTFTSDIETYGFEPELKSYRVGVKTGEFGTGTTKVRIGCKLKLSNLKYTGLAD